MSKSLKILFDGNKAWADRIKSEKPSFFSDLARQQFPQYLWIGCSDSRVPATELVDLLPGEIFVHRNIANIVVPDDLNCQSVIQYAVDVLKVKHIIVCGHYGCGGMQAVLDGQKLGLIDNWLGHAKKLLSQVKSDGDRLSHLCELNVIEQVKNVGLSEIVVKAWERGNDLTIHGWIYNLKDGLLKDLSVSVSKTTANQTT